LLEFLTAYLTAGILLAGSYLLLRTYAPDTGVQSYPNPQRIRLIWPGKADWYMALAILGVWPFVLIAIIVLNFGRH
jgi:hypothetical protein